MLDVVDHAQRQLTCPSAPTPCAIATIVATQGSVPRPVGTSMLVSADGTIRGSLSGGCVEGAVLEACRESLETGATSVHRFGVSEEDAFAVGLMCGGSLEVLVQPFAPASELGAGPGPLGSAGEAAAVAYVARLPEASSPGTVPDAPAGGPAPAGPALVLGGGPEDIRRALAGMVPDLALEDAASRIGAMIRSGSTGRIRLAPPQGGAAPIDLFVEARTRPAHLVVFGANAFGQALVTAARPLGLRLTLCDHRPAFTDPEAFPGAEVVRAWPHEFLDRAAARGELDERSMICVLTHDPKVDAPALARALDLDVAYVGAMGSRRSDRDRRTALREAGVGEEALGRLRSPIGLDLGASTPAEVAVAILAEILAVREGRAAPAPLRDGSGPLHPRTADASAAGPPLARTGRG